MRKLTLSGFLLMSVFSCTEKDHLPAQPQKETQAGIGEEQDVPRKIFEGITIVNTSGQLLGELGKNDLNDWRQNEVWSLQEQALFSMSAASDSVIADPEKINASVIAFPNPTSDIFMLVYHASAQVKFQMVLVNEDFEVLQRYSTVGNFLSHTIDIEQLISATVQPKALKAQTYSRNTFSTAAYPSEQVLRVYYTFSTDAHPHFYKGHGDILICRAAHSLEECYPYEL